MSRRKRIDIDISHLLSASSVKPELLKSYATATSNEIRHSKPIKIFTDNIDSKSESSYLLGYYDYQLKSYIAHKPSEFNSKAKCKVHEDNIKGWMYL